MNQMKIGKFLSKYYNIQGSDLNNLTHEQIIEMFEVEPCLGCDVAISDINEGKIVLVEDSERYVLGYKNPLLEKDNEECEELFEHPIIANFYKSLEHETGLVKDDVKNMELYELEELLKECKRSDDNRSKNIVVKELRERKVNECNNKESKLEKVRKREYRKEMIK